MDHGLDGLNGFTRINRCKSVSSVQSVVYIHHSKFRATCLMRAYDSYRVNCYLHFNFITNASSVGKR